MTLCVWGYMTLCVCVGVGEGGVHDIVHKYECAATSSMMVLHKNMWRNFLLPWAPKATSKNLKFVSLTKWNLSA